MLNRSLKAAFKISRGLLFSYCNFSSFTDLALKKYCSALPPSLAFSGRACLALADPRTGADPREWNREFCGGSELPIERG